MNSNSDEIVIRPATEVDIPDLLKFLQPFVRQNLVLQRSVEELKTLVQHGFAAIDGNERLVGFSAVEIYSYKLAEVQCLAVDPAVQGRGVGGRLIEHCVTRAREMGVLELMAITAREEIFRRSGFDYSLPEQKRALFIQTGKKRTDESSDGF